MRVVGIKVLKNRLSEFVKLAAQGERILVTDRDRVVAELVAPQAETPVKAQDAELLEAVRNGWVTPPREVRPLPAPQPVADFATVMRWLDESREDRL